MDDASPDEVTARLGLREVVRQLNAHLGPTLVAALAGVKDRDLAEAWARPDGPSPHPTSETRLLEARALVLAIARAESGDVARAWMVGSNPLLNGDTPITVIREARFKEVSQAAAAFLEGSPA